jgi:hypothetical protein
VQPAVAIARCGDQLGAHRTNARVAEYADETLNHPQATGREKDVAPKTPAPKTCPKTKQAAPKGAALQDIHKMARPGLEPGTPRFSVVKLVATNSAHLQGKHNRSLAVASFR